MNTSKLKILLIEDNPGDAGLIGEMLSGAEGEYSLKSADTLLSGERLLKQESFDLVLLDLGLPDSSGIDTLRNIQNKEPELPFIVLTGLADEELAVQAIAAGAQDYLVKGRFESDLLLRSIRYAIERKRVETNLRESEERYRIIAESALDAIITIDEESRIVMANPATERMFGYTGAELCGMPLTTLMPERLRRAHLDSMKVHVKTGKRHLPWGAVELPGVRKDGSEIPLEISYGEFVKEGRYFFIGIVRDIADRKKAEETIIYQTYHDFLTGLPNRAQLMLRFNLELAQAERSGKKMAVFHIDLDRFKVINDSLGHAVGNRVIVIIADRLKELIRKNDTLARIGGDEFIILLTELSRAEDAAFFANKIVNAIRKVMKINSHDLYLTASIGISIYPEDESDPELLLRYADIAISHVKETGRNSFQFFNPSISKRTVERLLLESSLRQSIERDELVLHYQPQANIRTGEIICVEALVRWMHPDLGLLVPLRFLPVAEEIGFITAIDEWVLKTACAQNKKWQDAGFTPVCVTINLSAQQFQQPSLVEKVSAIARTAGLDTQYLDIEVTEGTAMRDIDLAIPNLRGLHDLGVKLSIDDFGTGYSSLNYLKRFPVQTLKIDQSFIRGLADDPDDQEIVRVVVDMAHHMKMKVVAEGVETEEQLSFLREYGCDEMQGFLFSEPLLPYLIEEKFLSGRGAGS
jgi:diguanylate cyclase (GGDEF)-like protein/PAS domain S-box-containing protein